MWQELVSVGRIWGWGGGSGGQTWTWQVFSDDCGVQGQLTKARNERTQ